ncbi:MAG: PilZ domain-containing protein [Lentisphaerae bacterium]|nr:PilZ domain-containing protein [Lentisphaerota bacterium]
MPERRTAERVELKAKVRTFLVNPEGGVVSAKPECVGWTQDVSLGGIRVVARKPLPVHATVELEIDCKHPVESCQLRGQVGWLAQEGKHGYLIGIFIRESSKDRLVTWRRILSRRGLGAA